MEVITIQSEVWNKLQLNLQYIKSLLETKKKREPFNDPWLTIEETMAQLKVSKRTLQTYRDKGRIGFSQIDNKIYFKASEINAFLERHHHEPFSRKKGR